MLSRETLVVSSFVRLQIETANVRCTTLCAQSPKPAQPALHQLTFLHDSLPAPPVSTGADGDDECVSWCSLPKVGPSVRMGLDHVGITTVCQEINLLG